jgi:hypothetical protein
MLPSLDLKRPVVLAIVAAALGSLVLSARA